MIYTATCSAGSNLAVIKYWGKASKASMEMAEAEINAAGGVLGKKIVAEVVDPASNWPLFAEKA